MKKALKYFLLTIVVVILGFFSIGIIHPSYTYTNSIEIDCTVEEAFAAFTDESIANEWLIGYKGCEIKEGEPHKPGSKFLIKFENEGEEMTFVATLTTFKENEEFTFDMETKYFIGSVQVLFEGSYPCTMNTHTYNKGTSTFYCSMFYLMKSVMQVQSQKKYDLLKEVIEGMLI
jgi:hypothetical protein